MRVKSFLFFFFFLSLANIHGQVTVGSASKPSGGAILQLKENDNLGQNSTKGLLLPRVMLTHSKSLQDIGVSSDENMLHTGLMVYNVNQDLCQNVHKGVSIWSGTEWTVLGGHNAFETSMLDDTRAGDTPQKYAIGHFATIKPDGTKLDAGWWTLESMRATKFDSQATNTTAPIQLVESYDARDNEVPFYTYPDYNIANKNDVGKQGYYYSSRAIYNGWNMDLREMKDNIPPRVIQGICPNGWRVPTYEDWINLLSVLYNDKTCAYGAVSEDATARLINAMSVDDAVAGVRGTSRPLDEGGFNSRIRLGYPFDKEYSVYPSTYPTPFRDSADEDYFRSLGFVVLNMKSYGILNPRIEVAYNIAPVRCVKGEVPPQYVYKQEP